MGISEEPCLFDGRIKHFSAIAKIASQHPDPGKQHERETRHSWLAGRPRHGDNALRMDPGIVESVEIELGSCKVDRGVEPQRQLLVRERIDERRGLAPVLLRVRDPSAQARTPREYC